MIESRDTSTQTTHTLCHGSITDLETFENLVDGKAQLDLDESIYRQCQASEKLLKNLIQSNKPIYGVTTGFGPLVSETVPLDKAAEHQKNLICHLATGVGELFSELQSRAIFLTRIVTLCQGHSAISRQTLQQLVDYFNENITPCIPQMGTVGASGDLTPMAHLTLALTGEGNAWLNQKPTPSSRVLKKKDLPSLTLKSREGLALVNGTAAMTGIATLNTITAKHLWNWALKLAFLYAEVHRAKKEAFSPFIGKARRHSGQQKVHATLQEWLSQGSRLSDYSETSPLQDLYSLRCIPQIFGPVWETITWHSTTVENELNAATDNPLFSAEHEKAFHNGNFFGLPVALASDALSNAITNLAIHAERSIAKTTDPNLNGGLPAFLSPNDLGLHSGFMGAQTTATAVLAEMRSNATPASIQSIPTNANNQDVVPLGTIAARKAEKALENLSRILSIHALTLAQAHDLIKHREHTTNFSESSNALVSWIRLHSTTLTTDRPLSQEIEKIARAFTRKSPDDLTKSNKPTQNI